MSLTLSLRTVDGKSHVQTFHWILFLPTYAHLSSGQPREDAFAVLLVWHILPVMQRRSIAPLLNDMASDCGYLTESNREAEIHLRWWTDHPEWRDCYSVSGWDTPTADTAEIWLEVPLLPPEAWCPTFLPPPTKKIVLAGMPAMPRRRLILRPHSG
jgi:hypothetical protein